MFVDDLRDKIKGKGVRIVFTEGPDFRVQEAAVRLYKEGILEPVLRAIPSPVLLKDIPIFHIEFTTTH